MGKKAKKALKLEKSLQCIQQPIQLPVQRPIQQSIQFNNHPRFIDGVEIDDEFSEDFHWWDWSDKEVRNIDIALSLFGLLLFCCLEYFFVIVPYREGKFDEKVIPVKEVNYQAKCDSLEAVVNSLKLAK